MDEDKKKDPSEESDLVQGVKSVRAVETWFLFRQYPIRIIASRPPIMECFIAWLTE